MDAWSFLRLPSLPNLGGGGPHLTCSRTSSRYLNCRRVSANHRSSQLPPAAPPESVVGLLTRRSEVQILPPPPLSGPTHPCPMQGSAARAPRTPGVRGRVFGRRVAAWGSTGHAPCSCTTQRLLTVDHRSGSSFRRFAGAGLVTLGEFGSRRPDRSVRRACRPWAHAPNPRDRVPHDEARLRALRNGYFSIRRDVDLRLLGHQIPDARAGFYRRGRLLEGSPCRRNPGVGGLARCPGECFPT